VVWRPKPTGKNKSQTGYPNRLCGGGATSPASVSFFPGEKSKKQQIRFYRSRTDRVSTLTKAFTDMTTGTRRNRSIAKMYTLGHKFIPSGFTQEVALSWDSPLLCLLYDEGLVEAVAYHQNPIFEAAMLFARTEGFFRLRGGSRHSGNDDEA